jgi:CRP-like cAMP-binding protein
LPTSRSTYNKLLSAIPGHIQSELVEIGEDVRLPAGEVLHSNVGASPGFVFFPRTGVVSVRTNYPDGAQVEVAAVGRDGAFGLFALLGVPLSSMIAEVTIETEVTKVPLSDVRRLYVNAPDFRAVVGAFLASLFNEVVRSLGCYRFHSHDEWVARWLLVTSEKAGTDTLPVTHELIARRLGSQRHAVSTALAVLREVGAVEADRGAVTIIDRAKLHSLSCNCYEPQTPSRPSGTMGTTH